MKDRPETLGDAALQAAQTGQSAEVLALLKQGANPDALDRHGFTALARAAQYDRADLVAVLLTARADPNAPCKGGLQPLMAAKSGSVAEALLAAGANIDTLTRPYRGLEFGRTALMKAAGSGCLPVVQVLLAHGADVERRDSEGRSALILAAANGHTAVAQTLRAAGATVGLVEAAILGDVERVKEFLGTAPALLNDLLGTALWWAAGNGQEEAVHLLLNSGADVNARVGRDVTALIQAALMGQAKVVRLLLACGADVNAWDGRGATALHASLMSTVYGCNREVVRALLEAGAEVNARTRFSWPTHTGGTALMEAALRGATDCGRLLIENGADLEMSSDIDEDGVGGWTALLAAVANSRLEMVRLLIESGADVNNGGKDGYLPLTMAHRQARRTGRSEVVEMLLAAHADFEGGSA